MTELGKTRDYKNTRLVILIFNVQKVIFENIVRVKHSRNRIKSLLIGVPDV